MTTHRPLDPALIEEFRRLVLESRTRLLRTVATTAEELATLEPRQPGAPVEDAAREQVLTVLGRLDDRERHALEEIDAARARLEAGVFGGCEGCGGAIPVERLRAVPAARYCLACQARRDRGSPA